MILIRIWAVPIAIVAFMLSLIAQKLWEFASWVEKR